MEPVKLHVDFLSPPCRAVYIFMSANQIPVDIKHTNIMKFKHLDDVFTDSFPLKILPTIDDNGFCLHESIAILRYMASKYRSVIGQEWYPEDLKLRAKQDEYLSWHHHNTRFFCGNLFHLKMATKIPWKEPLANMTIAEGETFFNDFLQNLQDYFLRGQSYIGGTHPSIADLLCYCELHQLEIVDIDSSVIGNQSPLVGAWMKRMETRLQPDLQVASMYLVKLKDKLKNSEK